MKFGKIFFFGIFGITLPQISIIGISAPIEIREIDIREVQEIDHSGNWIFRKLNIWKIKFSGNWMFRKLNFREIECSENWTLGNLSSGNGNSKNRIQDFDCVKIGLVVSGCKVVRNWYLSIPPHSSPLIIRIMCENILWSVTHYLNSICVNLLHLLAQIGYRTFSINVPKRVKLYYSQYCGSIAS